MEEMKVPTMLKIREAAELTGLPYYRVWKLCKENKITHIKAGRRFYVNQGSLVSYLNGGTADA